jgi:CubicO group peptidase (beta-lactamase class C family)
MNNSGWSRTRLAQMQEVMAGHVERGDMPGLVTLVSRRGEVHVDAIGRLEAGGSAPMRRDTIFRITSMTKPITAAAAMILVEECKLRLDEPVDRLLPELANRRVLKRLDGPLSDTVPARRPITVRDVLTLRLGFGCVMAHGSTPIQQAVNDLRVLSLGPPTPPTPHPPNEWLRRFATLPLMHQPGEKWMYNTGFHVLSVLIARAAGQPLATFLHERIFTPLGMKDTAFHVPAAKLGRFATCYQFHVPTGMLERFDGTRDSQWSRPPMFPDGGAGLVSTVDDYYAFAQMLLNHGRHGNQRILSRASVELMTTDQLTPEQKAVSPFAPGFWDSRGWGLGVSIVTRRDNVFMVPGRFGWDGGYGTSWYSDPQEGLTGILMTQRLWASPDPPAVCLDFWTSVYQAMAD